MAKNAEKQGTDAGPVSFEKELSRLEEIVGKLEGGSLGLDEAIRLYEEGVRRLRACQQRLDQAEARIKMLVEGQSGPELKDFDAAQAQSVSEDQKADPPAGGEPAGQDAAAPRRRARQAKGRGLF